MAKSKLTYKDFSAIGKRCMDVFGSLVGLLITSPLMLFSAATIFMTMGRPIFFTMVRPGYMGQPFNVIKFRTMRSPHIGEVRFLSDNERLTRLGRILRKLSIDELPQFFNVLKGEMSLVGPRPLLVG